VDVITRHSTESVKENGVPELEPSAVDDDRAGGRVSDLLEVEVNLKKRDNTLRMVDKVDLNFILSRYDL
jgi:hypothetical protein